MPPHPPQRHHPPLLLLLLLLLLLPLTTSISLSARRAQTTFTLLTNSTKCASSITHSRIATFIRINPAQPTIPFDGILWDELLISGIPCQTTLQSRGKQSTYFRPRPPSPPGLPPDTADPFFLEGRDNSARHCQNFNVSFPATYLFTDDLPTFRERFERDGLIDPGLGGMTRGVVYMFAIPIPEGGDVVGRSCAYEELEDGAVVNTSTPTTSTPTPSTPTPSTPAESVDMPACFPADAVMEGLQGVVRMDDVRLGDMVRTPHGWESVISFTHRDKGVFGEFVEVLTRNSSVTLTKDHLLLVNGEMVPAGGVSVGDLIGGQRVLRVAREWKKGLYSPVTKSGVMIVQGVVVSCYTSVFKEVVSHALLSPVRAVGEVVRWDVCAVSDWFRDRWMGGWFTGFIG